MDSSRFDALARAAAAGTSRRSVLKGLAAGFAATLLKLGAPGTVAAQNTVPLGGAMFRTRRQLRL